MIIWIEDGVSTSINFNFRAWYEVEIRLNDDPRQKETIDGIIWLRRKKCIIYRLDIFSIAHVVQLMVSKMNFFCQRVNRRYPQRNMRWGIQNFIACQEAEKWLADWFYVTLGRHVWRNWSLCLRKRAKFRTWVTKTFLLISPNVDWHYSVLSD